VNTQPVVHRREVRSFLGRILSSGGLAAGTCFQVAPHAVVTACHVLDHLDSGNVGALVSIDVLLEETPAVPARVVAVDQVRDLAVLWRDEPLPGTAATLALTDAVELLTDVIVTGVSAVDDPVHEYRYLDATGQWQGGTFRDNQVALGRLTSAAVMPGMSGAPVLRLHDKAVVGVVSARYNSADGWLRDSVWVVRVEDVAALLGTVGGVTVNRRLAVGDDVSLVFTVSAAGQNAIQPNIESTFKASPSTLGGPREAALEASKVLAALDDTVRGIGLLNAVADLLTAKAADIGNHGEQEVREFRRRIELRGLDPRLLIRRIARHDEAARAWATPLDGDVSDDGTDDSSGMLLSFVQAFIAELSGELFAGVSEACRSFLAEALADGNAIPLSAFLNALDECLPIRRSTSREVVLARPLSGTAPATDGPSRAVTYRQLGLNSVAAQMCKLPDADPYVLGRTVLVNEIVCAIDATMERNQTATAFLSGQPGVGTSTVAIEVARELVPAFPDGVAYVNLRGLIPGACRDARTVVRLVSEAMKFNLGAGAMDDDRLFASFSAQLLGRQILLVLDDATDAGHVAKLVRLPAGCAVIVTSRNRLQDYASPGLVFRVEALTRDASIKVLARFSALGTGESSQLDRLAYLCDDVPLALRMIGARIASQPDIDLDYLIYILNEEITRLDYFEAGERAVRAAIRLSYDNLDAPAQRVFRWITAAPGSIVTGKELSHCLGESPFVQERLLNRLTDRSLAERKVARTFSGSLMASFALFELVRLFAKERLDDEEPESLISEFQHKLVVYLRDGLREILDLTSEAELSGELDPARFHAAERLAEERNWLDLAKDLALNLHVLYLSRHEIDSASAIHDVLVALHIRRGEYEDAVEACLSNADTLAQQGAADQALASARRGCKIASEHSLPICVAKANFKVSVLLGEQKDWAGALDAGKQAESALRKEGQDTAAIPVMLNNSRLAIQLGLASEALTCTRAAADLADRFGNAEQRAEAVLEQARAEGLSGDYLTALQLARRGGSLWKEVSNWWNAAVSYENGAYYAKRNGEISTAAELLSLAADCREQATADKAIQWFLETLIDLSAVYVESHSFREAWSVLRRAEKAMLKPGQDIPALMRLEVLMRVAAIRIFPGPPPESSDGNFAINPPVHGKGTDGAAEEQSDPEFSRVFEILKSYDAGVLDRTAAQNKLLGLLSSPTRHTPKRNSIWLHDKLGEFGRRQEEKPRMELGRLFGLDISCLTQRYDKLDDR
jgi:DNA polymerase III delta prime subunit